jgi:hypothetical protein
MEYIINTITALSTLAGADNGINLDALEILTSRLARLIKDERRKQDKSSQDVIQQVDRIHLQDANLLESINYIVLSEQNDLPAPFDYVINNTLVEENFQCKGDQYHIMGVNRDFIIANMIGSPDWHVLQFIKQDEFDYLQHISPPKQYVNSTVIPLLSYGMTIISGVVIRYSGNDGNEYIDIYDLNTEKVVLCMDATCDVNIIQTHDERLHVFCNYEYYYEIDLTINKIMSVKPLPASYYDIFYSHKAQQFYAYHKTIIEIYDINFQKINSYNLHKCHKIISIQNGLVLIQ